MKIIFTSPFNPLWSEDVSEIASLLDARVVSIGDLLRAEVNSSSILGNKIETILQSGEILKSDLVDELLSQRFFEDSANKVLVNYPINIIQAESLAKYTKSGANCLNACVVVNASKDSVIEKFKSQFHCVDSLHPKLETSEENPECEKCGQPMLHSYDLNNDKVAHLVESYFDEKGVLSSVSTLSNLLGIESIPYTTPQEVVSQIQGMSHENV